MEAHRTMSHRTMSRDELSCALGEAVARVWGHLPSDIQHDLFEMAVAAHGEAIRPQLAIYLHERHPRTTSAVLSRAILEPDSLGG
jgi:hypothetical protein